MTVMNSQHLHLHVLSPHTLRQSAVNREGARRSLPLTAELLATNRFLERWGHSIQLCTHWLAHQTPGHTENSVEHSTTQKVQNKAKYVSKGEGRLARVGEK